MNAKRWISIFAVLSLIALACLASRLSHQAEARAAEITFAKEVAPILYKNCAACHRPNELAPFSVLTYSEVRPWARAIKEQVLTRKMPPWPADARYGEFRNDARLSQKEIDTLVAWVDGGASEGDTKDLPPRPPQSDDWQMGAPDQVLTMPEAYTVLPGAPDKYVYFVIPTNFDQDRWIQAAEIRPGNKRVVHHAIAHILTPQSIARSRTGGDTPSETPNLPAIFYKAGTLSRVRPDVPVVNDGAQAANGGAVFRRKLGDEGTDLFSILLTSYAPGKPPDSFAEGMAKKIPAGSTLVLQMHYSSFRGASSVPQTDRTSIGLRFAKTPVKHRVGTMTVQNHFFMIPPGADNHQVTAAYTIEEEIRVLSYMPHMHLRGKDMKYEVIYPDGRRETLLLVSPFNFNWQVLYQLKQPITLPKGATLVLTAHFDNSAKNPYNPDPTQSVRWGDPTYDEMLVGWFDYVLTGEAPTPSSPAAVSTIFEDVTAQAGIDFQHYNGMTGKLYLPEITGSGAAFFDFDNDSDLDIFLVQGATLEPGTSPDKTRFPWRGKEPPRSRLLRNDLVIGRDGSRKLSFTDVTQKSGIAAQGYGMGVAVGDINNDGWNDLYLCNLGSNQMWLNNGDGTFTDVTKKSNTDDPRWSTSAAFFDYDRDGWLDLFVANYVNFSVSNSPACYAKTSALDYCGPRAFKPVMDRLFRNRGDGTFVDVTETAGISQAFGSGLGVVTCDFDKDGWVDIYVANDGDPNQLWVNRRNGTFKNQALLAGAAVNRHGQAEAGMGVDAGDYNGDGLDDIFLTHLMEETNTLYLNLGSGLFEDRTIETGMGKQTRRYTGFGTLWFDYDNDGWLDLFSANGAVRTLEELARNRDPYPLGQPNQLFHNTGKGSFQEVMAEAGATFHLLEVSRGAAFGDVDNDGDTDLLVCNNNGRARLLLNQRGQQKHWLGLRLVGQPPSRDLLGARVEWLGAAKGQIWWRRVRTDGGYLSAHDPRVLLGLGDANRVERVRVYWPSGRVEEWKDLPHDQYTTLKEGSGAESK